MQAALDGGGRQRDQRAERNSEPPASLLRDQDTYFVNKPFTKDQDTCLVTRAFTKDHEDTCLVNRSFNKDKNTCLVTISFDRVQDIFHTRSFNR